MSDERSFCRTALLALRRSITTLPLAASLALLTPSVARSLSNETTVDCSDEITASVCSECYDSDICYLCQLDEIECINACPLGDTGCMLACPGCYEACGDGACCDDPAVCTVTNVPLTRPPIQLLPLSLKAVVGPVTLVFQRKAATKNNQPLVAIKLEQTVKFSNGKKPLTVKIALTGGDALVGSLLYPVVFLGNGQNALAVLQSHGYNVSLAGTAPTQTCQAISPQTECLLHAVGLARQLDAMLAAAGDPETGAFEAGLQMLGVSAFGTTTTATSSTTTTTMCPAGKTNCSGTCANTSADVNNCGTCGNVCPFNNPSCISGVCTTP